jgi:hypothetical protein
VEDDRSESGTCAEERDDANFSHQIESPKTEQRKYLVLNQLQTTKDRKFDPQCAEPTRQRTAGRVDLRHFESKSRHTTAVITVSTNRPTMTHAKSIAVAKAPRDDRCHH